MLDEPCRDDLGEGLDVGEHVAQDLADALLETWPDLRSQRRERLPVVAQSELLPRPFERGVARQVVSLAHVGSVLIIVPVIFSTAVMLTWSLSGVASGMLMMSAGNTRVAVFG